MSDGKVFVDSNILVYAHDRSAGAKHEIARRAVEDLWAGGRGVLSTQVLQEFFAIVTRKIPNQLGITTARTVVEALTAWEVVVNDESSLLSAIDLHKRVGFSFWDSLIVQAACRAGAGLLLSEDLSHGQTVDGTRIENPFL